MLGDLDLKVDSLDSNDDIFGVPRDFVAPEDLRETAAGLSSFFVLCDEESA